MSEEHDIPDPEDSAVESPPMTAERAYVSSDKRTFKGQEIHGWSGRRRAATFEIGFTGNGGVIDPIRVIYCCVVDSKVISAIFRNGIVATEAFLRWAEDEECLDPSMDHWAEAMEVAQGIIDEMEKSEFKDETPGSPGLGLVGNSTGQQNLPPTSET